MPTRQDFELPKRKTPVGVSVRISRQVQQRREGHPECGEHQAMGWGLRKNLKGKVTIVPECS